MLAAGEQMLARWQARHAPGAAVDISREIIEVTLDIISRTMLSADVLNHAGLIAEAVNQGRSLSPSAPAACSTCR